METPESKVEISLHDPKVHSFLENMIELCSKHSVSMITDCTGKTVVSFHNWDRFLKLEIDSEGASLYWPRIQTEIVVRRKNEDHEVVSREKTKD